MEEVSPGGVSFIREGEGPPIIFIHGWGMAATVWERQIDYFAGKGFEAVTFDLRGHGCSVAEGPYTIAQMAYDREGFIHEMAYDKPFLVGWSMGGAIAAVFADRHPDMVGKLALLAPAGVPMEPSPLLRAVRAPLLGEWLMRLRSDESILSGVTGQLYRQESIRFRCITRISGFSLLRTRVLVLAGDAPATHTGTRISCLMTRGRGACALQLRFQISLR